MLIGQTPHRPGMEKAVYFISDMHLGASYLKPPKEYERRVVRFLDSLHGRCSELYMLGDVLDYWYEYRTVVPRGFVRFFGALARLADARVKITWFTGNHDIWLFDYLRDEIGVRIVDGPLVTDIFGTRFFMAHGDGVGKLPPTFRFLRSVFRNRFCQWLYAGIHPRWTVGFAHGWSSHSRGEDALYAPKWEGPEKDNLVAFCKEYLNDVDSKIKFFVFGHKHVLVDYKLGVGDSRMIILGDWIHHFSYGVFDGDNFSLHTFKD